MKRREFIAGAAAGGMFAGTAIEHLLADEHHEHCHPTYATLQDAISAPPEKYAFVPAIMVGTGSNQPDYMATVDVDPKSPTYSQVVGRFSMPAPGDELHHYGWNACSSRCQP